MVKTKHRKFITRAPRNGALYTRRRFGLRSLINVVMICIKLFENHFIIKKDVARTQNC